MSRDELLAQRRAIMAELAAMPDSAPNPRDFPNHKGSYDQDLLNAALSEYSQRMESLKAEAEALTVQIHAMR